MLHRLLPPKNPPIKGKSYAFSMAELLVVIGILVVLMLLAFPQFSRSSEQAKLSRCVHQMRQVSTLLFGVMGENNNTLKLFIDGSAGGERRWYLQAARFAGYTNEQAQSYFGCPNFASSETNDWFCYGLRVAGSPGVVLRDAPDSPRFYHLRMANIPEPGSFLLMTDSVNASTGRQSFRIQPPNVRNNEGVHLRHANRANVLFLDGHIESLEIHGLAKYGVSQIIDEARQVVSSAP